MISPKFFKHTEKLIIDNSPIILTAIGAVGSVMTAYLAGKASFKARDVLDEHPLIGVKAPSPDGHIYVSRTDVVKIVWKLYIPAVASGATTIAAIVCANRITTKRAAALALAYSISEKRIDEYKEKVAQKLTPAKQEQIKAEIAQQHLDANPLSKSQVIITGNGDVLCYDIPSDRYFRSNVETIRRAENDINAQIIHEDYVPLSDFYMLLNLPAIRMSEEVGWTIEKMLNVDFSTTLSEDNQPCVSIEYAYIPIRGCKRLPCKD